MDAKTTLEKLQVLLPHWIEHNQNHEIEFRKWAELARAEGLKSLAGLLDKATTSMAVTDEILKTSLSEAGGASPGSHPHPHSHSHHHH
jgi:hypothetical protein